MKVTVTRADIETMKDEGSIILITGTADSGERITFAGDHRPIWDLVLAVREQGEVTTDVEGYQIMGPAPAGEGTT